MDQQPTPHATQPLAIDPARGPLRVVIEQPRAGWPGVLAGVAKWILILLVVLVILGSWAKTYETETSLGEGWHSLSKTAADKVAIITVEGTIFGDETFVKKQIDHVRNDPHVKAVVLRVDSPGGTVTGSDYIHHHLTKMLTDKKVPMVVSMGSVCASGGYYVAMSVGDTEDTIFAEPTTWTGSIGVIIPHYDFSGLLEKIDVQDDSIASNPLKMMGSPTRKFPEPIRAEEQAILKGLVDSSFDDFKAIVLASRKKLRDKPEVQDVVFTGRIFTAKQAEENLLVDQLGFIEDAIDRAVELAHLDKSQVQAVKYHKPASFLDQMLFGTQSRKPAFDLSTILDPAAPRAYYLWTWNPGLAH